MLSVPKLSLALLLVAATASNGLSNAAPTGDYCSAMLARVNKERTARGISALCMNKKLQAAAQRHSDDMAKNNYMAHDGADGSTMSQRITQAGYEWDSAAENVAAGQEDVDSVMDSWMHSEGHRENILCADYTMFGTAYSYSKDTTYGYYWTQDFGSGETEVCDGNSTTPATTPPTKQETQQQQPEPTPVPTTSSPKVGVPATEAPVVTPVVTTPAPVATPAATTPAPVATPASTTPGPIATPAATTPGPVATPASTTPAPVATPDATTPGPIATPAATTPGPVATTPGPIAATTPGPIATPASTTPASVATPAATTTPPSTSQKDCESNF